jgi:hypothetical protein
MRILIALLLFVGTAAYAQDPMYAETNKPAETGIPPKKSNTIIIETTDDYPTTLRKMVGILSEHGYGVQTIDKDLGILTTTFKGAKSGNIGLSLHVREGESTSIIMRGTLDSFDLTLYGVTSDTNSSIEYKGMKGSPMMKAWEEMAAVAKAYPGAKLTYASK